MDDAKIASIEQQIANINGSLNELYEMSNMLALLIGDLQINLRSFYDEYDNLADDDATKVELANKIERLEKLIKEFKEKNAYLEEKIDKLENYINEEIKNVISWIEVTFTTLNHYTNIQALTAIINHLIEEYHKMFPNENYEDIVSIISNVEISMKNWVNESITGCYNEIAVLAAKLNALADDVVTDKELADAVAAQQQELEKAKEEMTEALYAAIADAIKNNGIISNQINEAIDAANFEITHRITEINNNIQEIEKRLAALEKRIQTIRFLPDYADGKVIIEQHKSTVLRFMISPAAATENIRIEHISAYISRTSSAIAESSPKALTIESVTDSDNGILVVKVNCDLTDSYFDNTNVANICIKINDDNNDIISEWIPSMWDYRVITSEANDYPNYEVYTDKGLLKWLYVYNTNGGKINMSLMKDVTLEQYAIETIEAEATYSYTGKRITTTNGTSVSNSNWKTTVPGCTFNHAVIDGNENIISGIRSNNGSTFAGSNGAEGIIRNLVLDDVIITSNESVGAFAQTNIGIIENCEVKNGYISCTTATDVCAGSIAGINGDDENTGSVKNCINYANVYSKGKYTGGMIGKGGLKSIVDGCVNYGNIKGEGSYIGGIIGYSYAIVNNLTNYGNIVATDKNGHVGGIIGNNDEQFIGENCNNYGNITIGGN
jgi:polyhydroxyalkanoate synthesis regulator phasin